MTRLTAAELIRRRADHAKPNMGLTGTKAAQVQKADVTIAKNYLTEDEISELNRIVVMWLDFAEDQARRRKQVFLRDWEIKLDEFLRFNDRDVLPNAGSITKKAADAYAHAEYELFTAQRRALAEAEGARALSNDLEQAAKNLPKPKLKRKNPDAS